MHPILAALSRATVELGGKGTGTAAGSQADRIQQARTLLEIIHEAQKILDSAGAKHFEEFWANYPRRDAKDAARRAWVRVDGDNHVKAIVDNIHARIRVGQWEPKDPARKQFIPMASTYLNQRRWFDVPEEKAKPWEVQV